jgi:hypothetical protein
MLLRVSIIGVHMPFESIQNYHEQLVLNRIFEVLAPKGESLDEDFLDDVVCVALNSLPPRYVRHAVDYLSHLSAEQAEKLHAAVDEAIRQAAHTVHTRRKAPGR